jgi:cell division protein FtsW
VTSVVDRTEPRRPSPAGPARRVPRSWIALAAIVAALCLVGLVMVLSSSSVLALRQHGSSWLFFRRQALWVAAGGVALVVLARVDYRAWRLVAVPLLVVAGALLVVVLIPGVGVTVNGSTRWIGIGSWRMQPAELAKLALLLFCADLLARRFERDPRAGVPLGPVLAAFGAVAGLVMLQPDMGTTLVISCIVLSLLWAGGTPLPAMTGLVAAAVGGSVVLGMAEPYRRARMISFLNPWADASNTGYQVVQSLVGMGTGRLTGVGIGASRAKWGFLPNAHTDFIFAILGEEVGLLGTLLVLVLFTAFAVLGLRAAVTAPDRLGALLAVGVTTWVSAQAIVNIGAVVGALPVSGVPLPFVSFGGSSVLILMAAVGLLLNISRQGALAGGAGRRSVDRRAGPGVRARR